MELKKYKLGEIAEILISSIDKKSKEGESPVRLCNFVDVYHNWAITADMVSSFMESTTSEKNIDRFSLKKGYVAFTKDSETRDDIGVPTYIAEDLDNTVLGYHCALVKPDENIISGKFLNAFLHSDYIKRYFELNATGSGMRYTLSVDTLYNIPILAPSLDIQKRIGELFSNIDRKICINRSLNHYLEAMAKQLYDYWFVQFDFPDAEGKPYNSSGGKMVWNEKLKRKIPAGWEIKTLNDIVNVKDGTHDSPKQQNTGYYLITSKHLQSTGIDFKTAYCISSEDYLAINKRSRVDTNDILFSMIGTIGNKYLVSEENINFAIKNMALIKSSENISIMYFLWFYLSSPDYIRYEHNAISGSIQKFLSLDAMRKIPVLFDEKVLPMFNQRVSSIYKSISNLNNENSILIKQRDELLLFLMNEQVSVNNDL